MSVQAMTRVMDASEAKGMARFVLLVMANRAGGDEDVCFASVERLARDCRVDARTIQRNIQTLRDLGELELIGLHPRFSTKQYRVMPVGVAERRGTGSAGPILPPERKELGSKALEVVKPSVGTTRSFFDEFWDVYPKHVGRRAAERAFKAALKRADYAAIVVAAAFYRNDPNRRPEFTKHPATWLNADCWLDEAETAAPPQPLPEIHVAQEPDADELERFSAAVRSLPWVGA